MKTNFTLRNALLAAMIPAVALLSCSKSDDDNTKDVAQLKKDIISDAATTISDSYVDMAAKAQDLSNKVGLLIQTTNQTNLDASKKAWKDMRVTWEETESWLFGPVESNDIDPRIDTWPVEFNTIDLLLAGNTPLTEEYVNSLDEEEYSLRGFHPIEYLLWGKDGNKKPTDFTAREKEYLQALTANLLKLSNEVKDAWVNGYATTFKTAGEAGNEEYPSIQSAYMALVDGMAGICDEVANAKMKDPYEAGDPKLEESPFAQNSITDFTNNLEGILKLYQGKFKTDGKGVEELVRTYNLSLDNEIKNKHAAAVAALKAINVPFGEAIISKQNLVETAMNRINDLAETLDAKLKPFLQQYAK
ncbi:MAG: imelysin family protein [Niabella sp.]